MLPELDASFVLNYLQNLTPDDGVALYLLLHDDDTPLMNIDPEQTIDPTLNDPLTSTVPSSTNIQSSHTPLLIKIVVPYKNDRGSTTTIETTPLNMLASSNGSLHGGVAHELVPENSLSKPILVEQKTPQVSTLCSNNMTTYRPAPSTRVAISRVVRSSLSLTTQVAA